MPAPRGARRRAPRTGPGAGMGVEQGECPREGEEVPQETTLTGEPGFRKMEALVKITSTTRPPPSRETPIGEWPAIHSLPFQTRRPSLWLPSPGARDST